MTTPLHENSRHPRCNGDDGNEMAFQGTSSNPQVTGRRHPAGSTSATQVNYQDGNLLPQIPAGQEGTHQRVVARMLASDRDIIHAFQWGHRVGAQNTVDQLHDRAETEAARCMADIAEDGLTVQPIPPLKNERGDAK